MSSLFGKKGDLASFERLLYRKKIQGWQALALLDQGNLVPNAMALAGGLAGAAGGPGEAVFKSATGAMLDTLDNLATPVPVNNAHAVEVYTKYILKHTSAHYTEAGAKKLANLIVSLCEKFHVDHRFEMALLRQESSYNPRCTSPVGAKGLGQLMPGTAAGMGVTDPYDPQQNLTASIRIIGGHLKKYGGDSWNITMEAARLALAAYNAGPGAVKKYKGIPPYRETRDYVKKVTGYYAELQRLVGQ